MGKFSIRRIITMVLLILCGIVAIIVGVSALTAKGDASNGESVTEILKKDGSFDKFMDLYKDADSNKLPKDVQILMLNGIVAKALPYLLFGSSIISFISVGLGLILTKVKGKSFGIGFLIFAILTVLAVVVISFILFKLGVNPLIDKDTWIKALNAK